MKKTNLIIHAFTIIGLSVASTSILTQKADAQYRDYWDQIRNQCFCDYAGEYQGSTIYMCCNDRTGACFYSKRKVNFC